MGKKHRKSHTRHDEPTTPLERVVTTFLGTVRAVHQDELEITRDLGRWFGHIAEKALDAGIEEARDKRRTQTSSS